MKDTKSDNEIIAEFMGYKVRYASDTTANFKGLFSSWPLFTKDGVTTDTVRYDTSWDWLMPVVEKIFSLEGLENHHAAERLRLTLTYVDLKMTHHAVVEFIRWYNSQKQ